jgi:hypothetical protein
MQLSRADIDARHADDAALKKTIRETAGRRADIEPVQAVDGNLKMVERALELLATAGDEARRLIDNQHRIFGKRLRGLADDRVRAGADLAGEDEGLGD